MARYLVLWRRTPTLWPTDPAERSKIVQKVGRSIDDSIKKGKIKEHGHFLDGNSGYSIWEAEATDFYRNLFMTWPYFEYEVHEIIPYKKSREIVKAFFNVPGEAAKK